MNKKNTVLALGDSHIRVFEHLFFKLFFPKTIFKIVYIAGASISGINNIDSLTKAYKIYKESLTMKDYDRIFITLGEVDTAYTLWNRSQKNNTPIDTLLEDIVSKYTNFLTELSTYAPVTVLSAPLATVKENEDCPDDVSGIRATSKVTQQQRTLLCVELNSKINSFTKDKKNIDFIDFDSVVLGKNNLVKPWLLNYSDKCDHHYKRWIYSIVLVWKLKNYFRSKSGI